MLVRWVTWLVQYIHILLYNTFMETSWCTCLYGDFMLHKPANQQAMYNITIMFTQNATWRRPQKHSNQSFILIWFKTVAQDKRSKAWQVKNHKNTLWSDTFNCACMHACMHYDYRAPNITIFLWCGINPPVSIILIFMDLISICLSNLHLHVYTIFLWTTFSANI